MVNTSHYIDTISEETILKYIKGIKENDFDYFLNFLKKDNFCTQYICKNTEEKAKIFLQKLINCFKLNNTNTTELYEVIKYNGSLSLKRISDWNKYEILLINEFSSEIKIQCKFAEFKYINRWGYEGNPSTYKIIYNNENILWINPAGYEPQYFILKNEKISGLKYKHKYLTIYKNPHGIFSEISCNTDFDEILRQYEKAGIRIHDDSIDLSEYFYKGFFYKGILWDRNWKKDISTIKEIGFINGLLKIELENITYPYAGYILIDIENDKIIKAEKIM